MKKKLIVVLMVLCAATLLFACGSKDKEENVKKLIKVGKYKGLELEKQASIKVTDEDVEAAIRSDLQLLNKGISVNGPAALWDTVKIDYVGTLNGEAFEGGTAQDQELTLGSNSFIEGFEEGVVGHNVGDNFNLDLTFPESYHEATLAGQAVVFNVTLKSITRLPELTDELLPEIGTSAKTVKEYKKELKKSLQESNDESVKSSMQEVALAALAKNCKIKKYPESRVIRITKDLAYQESYGAIMNSLSIDDAIMQSQGMTVEEKVNELLKIELAVEYIAKKEKIKVSEKEYEEQTAKMATQYGESDVEGFIKSYETIYGEGYIKRMMLQEKVAAFIVDNSKEAK